MANTDLRTVTEIRRHLVEDNGWTIAEFAELIKTTGAAPRTEEAWMEAVAWELEASRPQDPNEDGFLAYERHLETNPAYAAACEEDERRAQFPF